MTKPKILKVDTFLYFLKFTSIVVSDVRPWVNVQNVPLISN